MKTIRRLARSLALLTHLTWGLLLLGWHQGVRRRGPYDPGFRAVVTAWQRRARDILGLRVRRIGERPPGTMLVVANHVSWADIPVLAAELDPAFLAKAEIRHWPVIGWLAAGAGTLFIERGRPGQADRAIDALTSCLKAGHDVLFFPEGTTSDGTRVRRFHARLFQAALDAGVPVLPVALCYRAAHGVDTRLAFVDGNGVFAVLWELLGRREAVVELRLLPTIAPPGTRDELARAARRKIAGAVAECAGNGGGE